MHLYDPRSHTCVPPVSFIPSGNTEGESYSCSIRHALCQLLFSWEQKLSVRLLTDSNTNIFVNNEREKISFCSENQSKAGMKRWLWGRPCRERVSSFSASEEVAGAKMGMTKSITSHENPEYSIFFPLDLNMGTHDSKMGISRTVWGEQLALISVASPLCLWQTTQCV